MKNARVLFGCFALLALCAPGISARARDLIANSGTFNSPVIVTPDGVVNEKSTGQELPPGTVFTDFKDQTGNGRNEVSFKAAGKTHVVSADAFRLGMQSAPAQKEELIPMVCINPGPLPDPAAPQINPAVPTNSTTPPVALPVPPSAPPMTAPATGETIPSPVKPSQPGTGIEQTAIDSKVVARMVEGHVVNLPASAADSVNLNNDSPSTPDTQELKIRRQTLVDSAAEIMRANARDAAADQRRLSQYYTHMPLPVMDQSLRKARDTLSNTVSDLESARSGLDPSDLARFTNIFRNARDKAGLAADLIQDAVSQQNSMGAGSSLFGLTSPKGQNPLARSADLSELFGEQLPGEGLAATASANTQDALVDRLVMLNGLPQGALQQALKSLKLAETPELTLENGQKKKVPILHNGYIFGGSMSGTDCSAFVSTALPPDLRKGRFTTLDFTTMWIFRHSGKFPKPPLYREPHQSHVRQVAGGFDAIDIYKKEPLVTGDLLVFRLADATSGHVFIVRDFNPKSLDARVLEASQSSGTIKERNLNLSAYPATEKTRPLRPGLFALRLRASQDNPVCKLPNKPQRKLPKKTSDGGKS